MKLNGVSILCYREDSFNEFQQREDNKILLLDEATGALDIVMKREIQNTILDIYYNAKFDPTILNVTHSIEEAVYLSNRIYILAPNPCKVQAQENGCNSSNYSICKLCETSRTSNVRNT